MSQRTEVLKEHIKALYPPTGVDSLDVVSLWCNQHINSLPPFLYW